MTEAVERNDKSGKKSGHISNADRDMGLKGRYGCVNGTEEVEDACVGHCDEEVTIVEVKLRNGPAEGVKVEEPKGSNVQYVKTESVVEDIFKVEAMERADKFRRCAESDDGGKDRSRMETTVDRKLAGKVENTVHDDDERR